MGKTLLLALTIFGSIVSAFGQYQLTVEVHQVPDSTGKINVALYQDSNHFLKFDGVFMSNSEDAQKGLTRILFDNLPKGEYAVAIFHDKNSNNELDTNWLGIPKEKVAFSKAKMRTFGPPKYQDCSFEVISDTEISISL